MELSDLIRVELKSTASVSFFLVLALVIGSAASWFEGGAGRHAHAAVMGTSTTEANLPR